MFKLIASARIGFHYRLRMMECTEEGRCDDGCGRDNNISPLSSMFQNALKMIVGKPMASSQEICLIQVSRSP